MCRFIETICIEEGQAVRLSYHNERLNRTRQDFWGVTDTLHLEEVIEAAPYKERTKCRIEYETEIIRIDYTPYRIRPVHSLRLIHDDRAAYAYKSCDRHCLTEAFSRREEADDVLIVREGLLTDTSICNIALWNGESWLTPKTPLLAGTHRAALLDTGQIQEMPIRERDLPCYTHIRLFNALIRFGEIELPIEAITY
ncbi:MAG: aminotransferase class IV family protein [Parabacteroides sp.]